MKFWQSLGLGVIGAGLLFTTSANVNADAIYRLYNENDGAHFYTGNRVEKTMLMDAGWRYEGRAWKAADSGQPIYRLYNPNSGEHHFTTGLYERNWLITKGWRYESISGYSMSQETGTPVYRLFNPNESGAGSHHYTLNGNERNQLVSIGWRDEGVAFYQEPIFVPRPVILDISAWQSPSKINYDELANDVDGVIVRVQHGTEKQKIEDGAQYLSGEDKAYQTHIREFQKRGIPVAVYAFVMGDSVSEMKREATLFYQRAQSFKPTFWWGDFEKNTMTTGTIREGAEAFRSQLKALGAQKVGAYIANHLYEQFNLDVEKFDAIWIPTYGIYNNGLFDPNNKKSYPDSTENYDMHQYTSRGELAGYTGNLDLSRIVHSEDFSYLFG